MNLMAYQYDETLFLIYQKVPKVVLIQRRWSLLIRRLTVNVTLKSLLLLARIEKSLNQVRDSRKPENEVRDSRKPPYGFLMLSRGRKKVYWEKMG